MTKKSTTLKKKEINDFIVKSDKTNKQINRIHNIIKRVGQTHE